MLDSLIATLPVFLLYCFVQGITPGPANLCSLATTMRHGTAVALRQWIGLVIGFLLVAAASVAITWGARGWFDQVLPALSVVGALYVVWLAWKTAHPSDFGDGVVEKCPSVASGILVQVTNAKIMLLCLTALVAYVVPFVQSVWVMLVFGVVIALLGVSCNLVWILAGTRLRSWYELHQRAVDLVMAGTLLVCALDMVVPLVLS